MVQGRPLRYRSPHMAALQPIWPPGIPRQRAHTQQLKRAAAATCNLCRRRRRRRLDYANPAHSSCRCSLPALQQQRRHVQIKRHVVRVMPRHVVRGRSTARHVVPEANGSK